MTNNFEFTQAIFFSGSIIYDEEVLSKMTEKDKADFPGWCQQKIAFFGKGYNTAYFSTDSDNDSIKDLEVEFIVSTKAVKFI